MIRVLVLLCCAITIACGGTRATRQLPGAGTPFSISSIGSSYGIQARLEGSIAIRDRWVHVVAPVGAVRTYQLDRQDYWDLRLRAAIASCVSREFEIVSEGRAARLAPLLGLSRDSATLDTATRVMRGALRLDVGIPAGTDLARSWIALVFEWPFQSVMATYTIHTNLPLSGAVRGWSGRAAESPGERCR
jgi:hypothetical protein